MELKLKIGQCAKVERIVGENDTAAAFGSGEVRVFATPMMIGLMENAALKAVDSDLPEGYATVGIHLDVKHLAATPVGMKVWAEAELIKIDGKKLTFSLKAFDELDLIGEGTHERYIIPFEKFVQSAENKGK
ncbi:MULTISPECIES: thioesterase family protein [unclassified Fusibacter]|uniref:thioesterase family protein n=1 Tax=unclassified Fusibacter TaxID=2624464 RepID=UPI0010134F8E|nr:MULTISPECIES: thioesterase family protein [unclassified Fusibacter]MCK8059533.1 thioesterase family protein [Fusibacter sp. A2]NPE21003.1 thioesterase family protein [Fusibacter sp. A1]RXV62277.1 thioesterase [Fusibacter sp. A1]